MTQAATPTRRGILKQATAGLTALASTSVAAAMPGSRRGAAPDLGANVTIVEPDMPAATVQARLDAIFQRQERAHFSDERHAVLFLPGRYTADVNIGFFTQVAGLGVNPGDVTINGHVHVEADWAKGMALDNFWRGVENLTVRPPDGADRWAVSQAAPYRRVHLHGDLALDDGGWSSGGFIADSLVDGTVRSGSQQQWLTRSSNIGGWQGSNWNMMFMGVEGAPPTSFPEPPHTTLPDVPVIREKPFLYIDAAGDWQMFRPDVRRDTRGASWREKGPAGRSVPLSRFLIAHPDTPLARINAALAQGRHLLLTPGIYRLSAPIAVTKAGTIVLGLGLATLLAENGATAMTVADVSGVTIAGLLFDAGPEQSQVLLEIGQRGEGGDHHADPTTLSDLFFRVGGAVRGRVATCLEINSNHVIGDHLWIWRADHGDRAGGRIADGWDENSADQGLIVNGDDVTIYGLFVEHFQRYQTLWNGNRGRTYFYQNELPYDPPSQAAYMAGKTRGWAAYKVAESVDQHFAIGMGIYANFTADPEIVLEGAVEAPCKPGVVFRDVTTISLGGGKGTIAHLVNDAGAAATKGAIRQTLVRYPPV